MMSDADAGDFGRAGRCVAAELELWEFLERLPEEVTDRREWFDAVLMEARPVSTFEVVSRASEASERRLFFDSVLVELECW